MNKPAHHPFVPASRHDLTMRYLHLFSLYEKCSETFSVGWDMHDYPIMRLVAKRPKISQAFGIMALVAVFLCWLAPASHAVTAALAFVIAAVFVLCFVELVVLMANTLLPR